MAPFDDTMFLKQSVEVLSFFNEEQLRRVTPDIERTSYNKGQSVLMRGEVTSAFYIVKKGLVSATYKSKGAEPITRQLKAGEFFGEISLLEDMPSDAAIKAMEDETVILMIPSASFKKLLEMQPLLKNSLLAKVAERRKSAQAQP